MSNKKPVVARKGTRHVFIRKPSDETHKTLMLGVCGNRDVLKPLIILQQSFPLLGFDESEHLPENILLSKTNNGSMELHLFAEWLETAVVHHKMEVNPFRSSSLITILYVSVLMQSTCAIDLCNLPVQSTCAIDLCNRPVQSTCAIDLCNRPVQSTCAIDLCKDNKIEMLCYPGHHTYILQGPDVVLSKPRRS